MTETIILFGACAILVCMLAYQEYKITKLYRLITKLETFHKPRLVKRNLAEEPIKRPKIIDDQTAARIEREALSRNRDSRAWE